MITRFLFALIVIAMLPAAAQTTSAPQTAEGKSAVHGTVRRAAVVPESLRAPRALRSSTAQTAAVRVDKPLLHTLPGFTVITRDGLSVSSTSLAKKSNWILVYRHAKCLSCDRLMNTIAAGSGIAAGRAPSYVIVVVGKDKAAFSKVLADYAGLSNATWVSDPTGQSTTALKLHVAPVMYGMQGPSIVWAIPGNLSDGARVERQASAWVTSTAAPSAAATKTSATSPATPAATTAPPTAAPGK